MNLYQDVQIIKQDILSPPCLLEYGTIMEIDKSGSQALYKVRWVDDNKNVQHGWFFEDQLK